MWLLLQAKRRQHPYYAATPRRPSPLLPFLLLVVVASVADVAPAQSCVDIANVPNYKSATSTTTDLNLRYGRLYD
jgi:hypothetical protein